jgi:hypothetical protein
MKKAILVICVLTVLALLAVPVMAQVLFGDSDLEQQMAPSPNRPEKMDGPVLIAGGGWWRAPRA